MTENNKKSVAENEQTNDSAPKEKKPKQVNKKIKKSQGDKSISWAYMLVLLFAVVAASLSAYLYWLLTSQSQLTSQLADKQNVLQSSVDRIENELEVTNHSLQKEISERERAVSEHQALSLELQAISNKLGRTTQAWRLAEIEYLLELANHRLNLARDPQTAIVILKGADSRIKAFADPALLDVRKAISSEVTTLEAMAEPDIEGVALKLGSLAAMVDDLPLIDKERIAVAIQQKQEASPLDWKDVPKAVWEDIKSMVQVRRHQQPLEPLLPPAESWFLNQNLRLKLEQSRLALLRRNAALFRQYLEEAEVWISQFFDTEAAAVKSALETVSSLKAMEVDPKYPDVSNSLRLLRAYLQQQNYSQSDSQQDKGSMP